MKNLKELFTSFGQNTEKNETLSQNNVHENLHSHNHTMHSEDSYQCPMKCEGDKTYNEAGNCPVCNMKLVPVGNKSSHSHHHCC